MHVIRTIPELRQLRLRTAFEAPIGIVPTMGDLHAGHLRLIERCALQCATCITTIFVNPLQFSPNEDFDKYPRSLKRDIDALKDENVTVLFAPNTVEMYPDGQHHLTKVSVSGICNVLCGAVRPGHFDGVTTVIAKLFLITQPDYAFFGEKDWQQLTVIRRMVRQLNFPIEIIGVPTLREPDGLAMSSRNRYLEDEEREIAPELYSTLRELATQVRYGNTNYSELESQAFGHLAEVGFDPEYVSVRDPNTLQEPTVDASSLRVFAAARLGRARLIDNIGIER